jgi:hypothetical protein
MKSTFALIGAAALAAFSSAASADSGPTDSTEVAIIGTAEAFCSLPSTWQVASSTSNVSFSQFSGHTWTIPGNLVASTSGNAINSVTEVAIRVRGQAACNTTHTITLSSANGGLKAVAAGSTPPNGFEIKRRMKYDAHWRNHTDWGVTNWIPAGEGASITYNHGATVPPGNNEFDVRMGLLRDPTNAPMLAGQYTDQLIVTIGIPG